MPEAEYVCTIHDENIYMINKGDESKFEQALRDVAKTMNDQLGWCVDLRFGAVFGNNLYEAK
tara:strand:+ start:164 stop:349 length:186 start_codon:yes stop_codon:yes gene_type:complete